MGTPCINNKDSNQTGYHAKLTPVLSSEIKSPEELLTALQNGSVSNETLVENLIALVRALQSLCLSLQESASKKALNDSDIQTNLADMHVQIAKETEAELAEYLAKLEESKNSSLMDDIFGTILPFLAVVFPPLLAVYPLGPMSLFLNPDAPFGLGEIGKQIDSALGDGASKWLALALEIVATIAVSAFTCGTGALAKMTTQQAIKAVAKESFKNLTILGLSKGISEGGLDHLTNAMITGIEELSGEELSDELKDIIKIVVRTIAQVVLVVVAIRCASSKDGTLLSNLSKMFSTTAKLQKAMVSITFILQAGQAGVELWGGANTIEAARIQKRMDKLKALITEITGIDVNEKSKDVENKVKELQRVLKGTEFDATPIFEQRSKAANIINSA